MCVLVGGPGVTLCDPGSVCPVAETVVEPVDMSEASETMPRVMEVTVLSGHPLVMLRDVLSHVSIPSRC